MFSDAVLRLSAQPHHMGPFEGANVVGQEGIRGEGPFMNLYLRVDSDVIAEARFLTYACPAAMACGNWLTRWLRGRTMEAAAVISAEDLVKLLALPLGKEHCAQLAVSALRSALRQWQDLQQCEA